jgi:hypothetical protein
VQLCHSQTTFESVKNYYIDDLDLAPARDTIEYEVKVFQKGFLDDTSPYQGWPDDEKDQLWEKLYWSKLIVCASC